MKIRNRASEPEYRRMYSLWSPACRREMKTLSDFNTGTGVVFEDISPDATIYPTKFILKNERDPIDNFLSAKALCKLGARSVPKSLCSHRE